MAGKDGHDPATSKAEPIDYTQYLCENGLAGARIGIHRMFTDSSGKDYIDLMETIIRIMKEHGAECVEIPAHELKSGDKFGSIMNHEFKCGINHYLAYMRNSHVLNNLHEIIRYNQRHSKDALKYGQSKLEHCQKNTSGTTTEPEYIKAMLEREKVIQCFDRIFTDNKVDVMFCLAPAGLPAFTGFPSMTIPVRMGGKLPFGSFWTARRFHEASLIRITYALEQILHARQNPLAEKQ